MESKISHNPPFIWHHLLTSPKPIPSSTHPTNSFKLNIRQMSFQIASINISRQPIVCDEKQVIRINFRRLVDQHRMGHIWQGPTNRIGLVLVIDSTGVCAWCGNFGSQSPSITIGYWIDWNFLSRKLRTSKRGTYGVGRDLLSDFPHENSVLCVLSPNPPYEKSWKKFPYVKNHRRKFHTIH